MNSGILKEEKPCTSQDLAKLEAAMCKSKEELRIAGILILVLSVILPFLPPKYSGNKAMLDIMSYSAAVAGIVTIFGVVFLWSVYFMLYGLYKDLKHKTKISVNTSITSTGSGKYKGREFFYFSAAGLPYRISKVPVNKVEFESIKESEGVVVYYSKFGKRLLGWTKT